MFICIIYAVTDCSSAFTRRMISLSSQSRQIISLKIDLYALYGFLFASKQREKLRTKKSKLLAQKIKATHASICPCNYSQNIYVQYLCIYILYFAFFSIVVYNEHLTSSFFLHPSPKDRDYIYSVTQKELSESP